MLSTHLYLLGAYVGSGMAAITSVRNFASLYAKMKRAAPFFILLYVSVGIYRYTYWIDILPIMGVISGTSAIFYLKKVRMRLCFLFSGSCWIVHHFVVGSIGPLFMEIFIFSANFYTILSMTGIIKTKR